MPERQKTREPERLLDYPFPLRDGRIAVLRLPAGLHPEDAERLAAFIQTLALDAEPPRA